MNPQDDAATRTLGLIMELEVSISLIETGLALLQRSTVANTKHFAFLLLLASGLERLMKILVVLNVLNSENRFLTRQEHQKLGHDLSSLKSEVVGKCFTANYLQRPIARDDLDFIAHDPVLNELLNILSDFAQSERYIFLDLTAEPTPTLDSPDRRWDSLELSLFSNADKKGLATPGAGDGIRERVVKQLIRCLEQFTRALCRLFALGDLGAQARKLFAFVKTFAQMTDAELGTITYQV